MWYIIAFLVLIFGKTDAAIFWMLFAIARDAFAEKEIKKEEE